MDRRVGSGQLNNALTLQRADGLANHRPGGRVLEASADRKQRESLQRRRVARLGRVAQILQREGHLQRHIVQRFVHAAARIGDRVADCGPHCFVQLGERRVLNVVVQRHRRPILALQRRRVGGGLRRDPDNVVARLFCQAPRFRQQGTGGGSNRLGVERVGAAHRLVGGAAHARKIGACVCCAPVCDEH